MISHPALIEGVFKDIPRLSPSRVSAVSSEFGIANVSDFNPEGDRKGRNVPWANISRAVLARDDYTCRLCGSSSLSQVDGSTPFRKIHFELEVHHIIPRKDGGSDTFGNLITLCEECHHKTFSEGYSGIPADGTMDLFSFEKNILFALPPDSQAPSDGEKRSGVLADYDRVFDQEENRYRVVPVRGSRMRISLASVTIEEYRDMVTGIIREYDIHDYVTIVANLSGRDSRVRALVDSGMDLLV